jgi:hypothetical protein
LPARVARGRLEVTHTLTLTPALPLAAQRTRWHVQKRNVH